MSEAGELVTEVTEMFSREANWKAAVAVICDVMRGSSKLSVETHVSAAAGPERRTDFSNWSYEQTQPFRVAEPPVPRLFTIEHLRDILLGMSKADIFYVYEVNASARLGPDLERSLADFSSIEVSLVTLTVGDVVMAWVLVSLGQARDDILWKMQYHLRNGRL